MTTKNRIIRAISLTLVSLTISAAVAAQEWQKIAFPDENNITGVCFVHADTGFVVTDGGRIGRTVDGGDNWRMTQVTGGSALEDVSFLSGNLGFVCGRGASLYRTIDGGLNWDNLTLEDTIPWLFDVEMLDAKHIIVAGATRVPDVPYEGLMLRSDDGGKSFETMAKVGIGYKEFYYRRGGPVYLLTMGGLSQSHDLGKTWQTGLTIDGKSARALSFAGRAAVMAGPQGMIAFSADSGRTWRANDQAENQLYIAAEMIDDKIGYIGGWPETIMKTVDGGLTWQDEPFEPRFNILDFCLIGSRLYAVGSGGNIMFNTVR